MLRMLNLINKMVSHISPMEQKILIHDTLQTQGQMLLTVIFL